MIERIEIIDRGAVPRRLRPATNAALKLGYYDAAEFFHTELRDRRFTEAHGQAAGYRRRSADYQRRKERHFRHRRPLELTGDVRDRIAQPGGFRLQSTTKVGRVVYPGARGFNRRPPGTNHDFVKEFTTILPEEAEQFADVVDSRVDSELGSDNFTRRRVVS